MTEKKYQIFVSSTYTDLKDERLHVLNAITGLKHLAAGMELFVPPTMSNSNISNGL